MSPRVSSACYGRSCQGCFRLPRQPGIILSPCEILQQSAALSRALPEVQAVASTAAMDFTAPGRQDAAACFQWPGDCRAVFMRRAGG